MNSDNMTAVEPLTIEEIRTRLGLLPRAEFLEQISQRPKHIDFDVTPHRCTGRTTENILAAIARSQFAPVVIVALNLRTNNEIRITTTEYCKRLGLATGNISFATIGKLRSSLSSSSVFEKQWYLDHEAKDEL